MKKRTHPEDALHKATWEALTYALPADAVAWSVENRACGPIEGRRRKERGCVAGVPDLHVLWQGRYVTIELKAGSNSTTPIQKAFHKRLTDAGALVATCRSVGDVLALLKTHGLPLRLKLC